jgi:hypothetical protein
VGLAWNDPVTSETQVVVEKASAHLLYLHSIVMSDLLKDWGLIMTPKQASPWLDESVAKELASERFFIQSLNTYSFTLQVPAVGWGAVAGGISPRCLLVSAQSPLPLPALV